MKLSLNCFLFAVLLFIVASVMTGCVHEDEASGNLPWSRPASWEGQQIGIPY